MNIKTFAIITDIHSNVESLNTALKLIRERPDVDQVICLGDCFSLGPDPEQVLELLQSIPNLIIIRGNHDRYLIESLWEHERPSLEGMDPDDPICQAIVSNQEWTAQRIGPGGLRFIRRMHVAHREIVGDTLVEFTHAWYERDDQPPSLKEALNWRKHVHRVHDSLKQYVFIHGHTHIPRRETADDLKVLCQGAIGMPFDDDPRGALAFLTIGNGTRWDVIRYEYDRSKTMEHLEQRKPPFYSNLINTVKYAAIRNDV